MIIYTFILNGEVIHKEAEKAREEGNFLGALKLTDAAMVAYQEESNTVKFAEILCSRALTLRHMFENTTDKNYAKLAKFEAKAAVKILEMKEEKNGLGIAYYTLAKCLETLEKFEKAKVAIDNAIQTFDKAKDDPQAKPSVIAEIKTRQATLEYRLGDDSAIDKFKTSLDELSNSEEDSYIKDSWKSGAHLHMASVMIARDQNTSAEEQLKLARKIIESNPELKLRSAQLNKLSKK